jgi:hypothetical protein
MIVVIPCHKGWQNMQVAPGGRYCDDCCKVVVDFSAFTNDELIAYLEANRSKSLCGHFRTAQIVKARPKKRFFRLVASLVLVFGSFLFTSCGNNGEEQVDGGIMYVPDSAEVARLRADSTRRADSSETENLPREVYKLSKEDSARIADSVERRKNHIRDFN